MKVVYHPAVQRDVSRILRHYDSINDRLGDEFWGELNSFINLAAAKPARFHLEGQCRRRVNLKRFPYHFLFREIPAAYALPSCAIINNIPSTALTAGRWVLADRPNGPKVEQSETRR